MRKTRAIGEIPPDPVAPALVALKEVIEWIAGRRNNRIEPLAPTATLAQVIVKVNALIDRLDNA